MTFLRLFTVLVGTGLLAACGQATTTPGGADVGAVAVCVPGATQACVCAGAKNGGQVCGADGLYWLPCECTPAKPEADAQLDSDLSEPPDAITDIESELSDTVGPDAPTETADDAEPDLLGDAPQPDADATEQPEDVPATPDATPALLPLTLHDPAGAKVSSLAATHVIGQTACPQPIGSIMAHNDSAAPAQLVVSLSSAATLTFLPSTSVTVAAGATSAVEIKLTCANAASFTTTIIATFENGAGQSTLTAPVQVDQVEPPPGPCANKQCGTGSDGSSCGTCAAGLVCSKTYECMAPLAKDGAYCGDVATCQLQIPDPSKPGELIENPDWPACANAQCSSGYCSAVGAPGAWVFNLSVCSRPCNLLKDLLGPGGVPVPDGVEDLDTPLNECDGFVAGPNGAKYRCVNFGFAVGVGGLGYCVPTSDFRPCEGDSDCPAGEGCQYAVVGNQYDTRCVAKQKSGPWFEAGAVSEVCGPATETEDRRECGSGLCYPLGCSSFCGDDADCDTTAGHPNQGCDTSSGTCKGWPDRPCQADVDCSAWTCLPEQEPFGSALPFTSGMCWPRTCEVSSQCGPDHYCDPRTDNEPPAKPTFHGDCLARTPGGAGLGGDCVEDQDCAGYCSDGFCAALCLSDADCGQGQLCAVDETYADTVGDGLADAVVVIPECRTVPGPGGPCLAKSDCLTGQTCVIYQYPNVVAGPDGSPVLDPVTGKPVLDPDGLYTTRGKCVAETATKGLWGDLCGPGAGADFETCNNGPCRLFDTEAGLGFCTHTCKSTDECPAFSLQLAGNAVLDLGGYCSARTLGWAPDIQDNTRRTYVSECRTVTGESSLADCSATLTCGEPGEACAAYAISFGPEVPTTIDYRCTELKDDSGTPDNPTDDHMPSKTLGQSCNPNALGPAGQRVNECLGGYCVANAAGNGSYCSQLCALGSDTTCAAAGLTCKPSTPHPRAGKYKVNEASFGLCRQ
ncbi:MAG: hypothetical protein H6744_01330 [Deltaproteobacteria bacterium]|nr:hypothetical protein [Deltaproteobacteria bacterium]